MSGAIFRWLAPVFARSARRWSADDARAFARLFGPSLSAGGRLLDLGGGTGILAAQIARTVPCRVIVADASPQMLRYAAELDDVVPVLADAADLPFPADSFDAALVCDAFHHFVAPEEAARQIARVVHTGGAVVIAETDPAALRTRLGATGERLLGEPARFYTPSELVRLLADAGVRGTIQRQGGASYVFIGAVR